VRLPYHIRHQINPTKGFPAEAKRSDWVKAEDEWRTEDGRYRIVEDPRFGLVVAEIKNFSYCVGV